MNNKIELDIFCEWIYLIFNLFENDKLWLNVWLWLCLFYFFLVFERVMMVFSSISFFACNLVILWQTNCCCRFLFVFSVRLTDDEAIFLSLWSTITFISNKAFWKPALFRFFSITGEFGLYLIISFGAIHALK